MFYYCQWDQKVLHGLKHQWYSSIYQIISIIIIIIYQIMIQVILTATVVSMEEYQETLNM